MKTKRFDLTAFTGNLEDLSDKFADEKPTVKPASKRQAFNALMIEYDELRSGFIKIFGEEDIHLDDKKKAWWDLCEEFDAHNGKVIENLGISAHQMFTFAKDLYNKSTTAKETQTRFAHGHIKAVKMLTQQPAEQ